MGWTRTTRRATTRQHRPLVEGLDSRLLLSTIHGQIGARHEHAAVASFHQNLRLKTRPSPTDTSLNGAAGSSGDLIGAAQARSTYGVDGSGMTVAVIDTGINYNHEALGGGFGDGHKVVAGYDFTENDGDPSSTVEHGTAVAGLIASSDPSHPGVAPGADLAALRVFNNSSQGNFQEVANALQWVIDNHSKYNITAVNLSMSDGKNYVQNWFAQDGGVGQQITGLVAQLDALNIPVIAATGNSLNNQSSAQGAGVLGTNGQGVGFPAIIPDTISVTSTDPGGTQLSSDAQRLGVALGGDSATDIAAPGENLVAPVQGNQFANVTGTSFATAEVTGAVVLLQQIYESRFGHLPTVDDVDTWLREGSNPVSDPITGIAIGRLDVPKAASNIPNPAPQAQVLIPPTTTPTTGSGSAVSPSVVISIPNSGTGTSSNAAPPDQQQQQQQTGSSSSSSSSSSSTSQTTTMTTNDPSSGQGGSTSQDSQNWASVDGESLGAINQEKLASRLGSLFPIISGALKSLSAWGADGSGNPVRIWTNAGNSQGDLGTNQPSGQIKAIVGAARPDRPTLGMVAHRHPGHPSFVRRGHRR